MYGVIHFTIRDMVVSLYGQEYMDRILVKAGMDESKHFKMFQPYSDQMLLDLLAACSSVLGLSHETILEEFGDYFLVYCLRHGYDDMLRTLGTDMSEFLQNLDSLHSLLALTYENMVAPSFRCEENDDGTYILHYHSIRSNLHPLVKGLITAVGREIFYKRVDVKFQSSKKDEVGVGHLREHVTFHLTVNDLVEAAKTSMRKSEHLHAATFGNRPTAISNVNETTKKTITEPTTAISNKPHIFQFFTSDEGSDQITQPDNKTITNDRQTLNYEEVEKRPSFFKSQDHPFAETLARTKGSFPGCPFVGMTSTLDLEIPGESSKSCGTQHASSSQPSQSKNDKSANTLTATPQSSVDYKHAKVHNLPPVVLSSEQICKTFPYHFIFDKELRLRQFGKNIARMSIVPLFIGLPVTSAFHVIYPRISLTIENILRFINTIFIVAVGPAERGNLFRSSKEGLSMRGQMIWLPENDMMLFVGSPRLQSLAEMRLMNIHMSDIPLYDVTREMVLLYQQRNAEIDITKELDETTAELRRISRELAQEKERTDRLLYQMLPAKVADQLKMGRTVEAEKFDMVTILFSDIVDFTSIAAACNPLDVVTMLNDLYHKFDVKSNEIGVYKVETVGDAYMVVSGVPEVTENHAQNVSDFALAMTKLSNTVSTPGSGKPIRIRVGVHTGPVVAGVVGVKMPRYCLFGDTVNTASRMESHGVPARIHVSLSCYRLLRGQGYHFRTRNKINIKGKGFMQTFFLIGKGTSYTCDPDDEFRLLPKTTMNDIYDWSLLNGGGAVDRLSQDSSNSRVSSGSDRIFAMTDRDQGGVINSGGRQVQFELGGSSIDPTDEDTEDGSTKRKSVGDSRTNSLTNQEQPSRRNSTSSNTSRGSMGIHRESKGSTDQSLSPQNDHEKRVEGCSSVCIIM